MVIAKKLLIRMVKNDNDNNKQETNNKDDN